MAGTPTGTPEQDSAAGQRADEDGLAPGRPVPQRWSPSDRPQVQGLTPDPAEMKPYATPPSLTGPVNAAVMRTAPGE